MQSRMHPKHYLSHGIFKREQEKFFRKAWLFAGLKTLLSSHNAFVTRVIAGIPIVIQTFHGELRAFENVCLHRRALLQTEPVGKHPLACAYHAWRYDQDETADPILFEVLKELYDYGFCQSFFVVDTPRIFLNALLKLKTAYPEAELSIKINPAAIQEPEPHFEFYQRCLNLVIDENEGNAICLSGSVDAIASRIRKTAQPINTLFFMQRSIVDLHQIRSASGNSPYRLILRQADTAPTNLICALIN